MSDPSFLVVPYDQSTRILNQPILSSQDVLALDKYYILYWEARYLHSSMTGDRWEKWIEREKVRYKLYFSSDISSEYLQSYPDHQVRISFRRIKNRISGIALVSKVKGEQNESI